MKRGFTLAEVLVTLVIIGVIAAYTVVVLIGNSEQKHYQVAVRRAIASLNKAITINMALDNDSPLDNSNLFGYLMLRMAVLKSTTDLRDLYMAGDAFHNAAFYTTDGVKFEFRAGNEGSNSYKLYESNVYACSKNQLGGNGPDSCGGCGSYGLSENPNNTTNPPCVILVDVNGDKKKNPASVECHDISCAKKYTMPQPDGRWLTDTFAILITERAAIPYGYAAQKAVFEGNVH